MAYYKPQSPLIMNGNGIYPLTTYDQIILANGDRWDGKLGVPVSFASTLNSGTEIGTITIDGIATKLYHQALPLTGGVLSGWLYAKNRLATYTDNYPQIQFCNENQDELGLIFVGTTDGTHQEIRIRAYSNASSYYDHIFFGHGGFQTKGIYLKNNDYPQIQFNNEDGKPRGLIYHGTGDGSPGALAFRAYSDDTNFKEMYFDPNSGILYSEGFSGYLHGTAQEAVHGLNLKGVHEDKVITSWMGYNDNSPVFIAAVDGITQWGIQRDGENTQLYAHFYDTTDGAYLASHTLLDHYNYSQYALPLAGGTLTGNLAMASTASTLTMQNEADGNYYTILQNHNNGNLTFDAPGGSIYIGYYNPVSILFNAGEWGRVTSSGIYGAVWNDYAEFRSQNEAIEPGYITYCDDDGKLKLTTERLQKFEGVVSDTFGFAIGETDDCKTPLAVSGRALIYCDPEDDFHSGDCVCAGPNGLAYRMTREEIIQFPDRIVGIVSEIPTYETWGTGNVEVNGRIWVKVR